ncbi:uncharacterized protein LACBIDRAFT_332853 [Laccaria bicolor S238N-H82]|uniref:Predicted protein n=1 Tax=Laccaria bicolor (strain S238N-H82 / ATCC MYA-4686) TaxID=486041 RepID=B0DU29_LACBS|nr:uncharacterized protein LACBIDRAFT_332853 [Laccaria bicolor S238N-H82]EDR01830.1 predicted protein [Laccaria bicolor S238N-H82]|eukprot:XP_001887440.1 predicted protein [Laccaria bicolor S238N-H82]
MTFVKMSISNGISGPREGGVWVQEIKDFSEPAALSTATWVQSGVAPSVKISTLHPSREIARLADIEVASKALFGVIGAWDDIKFLQSDKVSTVPTAWTYNSMPMIGSDCGFVGGKLVHVIAVIEYMQVIDVSSQKQQTQDYDDGHDTQWSGQSNVLRWVSHCQLQIEWPELRRRAVLLGAERKELVCAVSYKPLFETSWKNCTSHDVVKLEPQNLRIQDLNWIEELESRCGSNPTKRKWGKRTTRYRDGNEEKGEDTSVRATAIP